MTLRADRLSRPAWRCVHFTREGPAEDDLTVRGIALVRVDGGAIASL